jgi:hypothetical protein
VRPGRRVRRHIPGNKGSIRCGIHECRVGDDFSVHHGELNQQLLCGMVLASAAERLSGSMRTRLKLR